jgi:hypothetical protein
MYRKFPSIFQPEKFGFAYDDNIFDRTSPASPSFRFFDTFGHGLTPHSVDRPVGHEMLADYLHSLAAAMLTDVELTASVLHKFNLPPTLES